MELGEGLLNIIPTRYWSIGDDQAADVEPSPTGIADKLYGTSEEISPKDMSSIASILFSNVLYSLEDLFARIPAEARLFRPVISVLSILLSKKVVSADLSYLWDNGRWTQRLETLLQHVSASSSDDAKAFLILCIPQCDSFSFAKLLINHILELSQLVGLDLVQDPLDRRLGRNVLSSVCLSSKRISEDQRKTDDHYMQVFRYLADDRAPYHHEAANLIWSLQGQIPMSVLPDLVATFLAESENAIRIKKIDAIGLLWRYSSTSCTRTAVSDKLLTSVRHCRGGRSTRRSAS